MAGLDAGSGLGSLGVVQDEKFTSVMDQSLVGAGSPPVRPAAAAHPCVTDATNPRSAATVSACGRRAGRSGGLTEKQSRAGTEGDVVLGLRLAVRVDP